jgi:hypothetical protein
MLWGGVFEHPPFDQSIFFHASQGLRQDVLRDSRQATAQFRAPLGEGDHA